MEAVKRLARYTHLTHAKDGLLRFGKNGLVRQGKAPGQGSIEWEPILKTLKEFQPNIDLSIEDHKVLWYIDIYKQEWYQDHPDVCAYEISQMVRLAKETEEKESQGLIPDMNKYESVPYLEQMNERLTFGRNYLRSILAKVR